jgi:hypothetical protein
MRRLEMEAFCAKLMKPITSLALRGSWFSQADNKLHHKAAPKCSPANRSFQYIKALQNVSLWPVVPHSWNFAWILPTLRDFSMHENRLPCCEDCRDKMVDHVYETVYPQVLVKANQGLCLDCVRREMASNRLQGTNEEDTESVSGSGSGSESTQSSEASSDSGSEDTDSEPEENEDEDLGCRVKHCTLADRWAITT